MMESPGYLTKIVRDKNDIFTKSIEFLVNMDLTWHQGSLVTRIPVASNCILHYKKAIRCMFLCNLGY